MLNKITNVDLSDEEFSESRVDRDKRAFEKFPNSVARDNRLDAASLVVVAYRSTIADDHSSWGISPADVKGIVDGRGLGRNVVERVISKARTCGYLERWQPASPDRSRFLPAKDRLRLPPCGTSGKAWRVLWREWFDGRFTLNELAALIFLRAGTGKGPAFASELAERFGWSRPTAAKVINGLIAKGVIRKDVLRAADGTVRAVRYPFREDTSWSRTSTVKKPGHGKPGHGISGHSRSLSDIALHALPTGDNSSRTAKQMEVHRSGSNDATPSDFAIDDLWDAASSDDRLLGWIWSEDEPHVMATLGEIESGVVQEIAGVVSDEQLKDHLLTAANNRISPVMLTPAGLFSVRVLAAALYSSDYLAEEITATEAIAGILNAIADRVGKHRGVWLNSLSLIGKRVAGKLYTYPDLQLYQTRTAPAFKVRQPDEQAPPPNSATAWLDEFRKADGARILAPKVYRDQNGLFRLYQKFGDDALRIIKGVLWRAMIDGDEVGKVRSWSYFIPAIEQEIRAQQIEALGMKPGDCFGAHRSQAGGGRRRAS